MTTFIGHISALQLLVSCGSPMRRIFGRGSKILATPTRAMPQSATVPDSKIIAELGFPEGIYTEKLHVNVADSASRSRSQLLKCHVWPAPQRGSYLRVDNEYCVQTPEACFAQLAADLPLPHLVETAMMLCGTYAPGHGDQPTVYDIEPLTNPRKMELYLKKLKGKRGIDNARLAVKLVGRQSGSPHGKQDCNGASAVNKKGRQGRTGFAQSRNRAHGSCKRRRLREYAPT